MAQLHLYLPEDLAEKVRQRAASRRQSVSDYLAELVRGQIADAWPEGYFENVVGGIREAFDAGELPWTKARKIVSVATSETEAEWLEKARALSNRDLEKEVRRHDGRGSGQFATLTISMPVEILDMWNDAYELAERLSGTELEKWQVLEPSLAEFLGTHLPADGAGARETDDEKELPDKVRDAVLDRDGWKCKFPGCTMRKMLDVHHIEFRSHLGSEDLDNKISLCRIHHELIHRGICRVTGAVGVDLKFERPQLVTEQKPVRAEVVDEPPEEASNEELASPDGDESWRDEIVADIFDGPRPPKPEMPHKDYGDFIAHWVKQKRASDLEERAKTRRAGQARPGAHDGMDSSRDLIGIDVPRSAVGLRLSREQKGPSCHPSCPNLGRLHYYELEHGAFGMTRLREFMRGLVDGGPTPSGHRTPAVNRGIGEPPAIGRNLGVLSSNDDRTNTRGSLSFSADNSQMSFAVAGSGAA